MFDFGIKTFEYIGFYHHRVEFKCSCRRMFDELSSLISITWTCREHAADGKWIMELRLNDGSWTAIRPTGGKHAYRYLTHDEAERMLEICYPDQCRAARLGADRVVRVRELSD